MNREVYRWLRSWGRAAQDRAPLASSGPSEGVRRGSRPRLLFVGNGLTRGAPTVSCLPRLSKRCSSEPRGWQLLQVECACFEALESPPSPPVLMSNQSRIPGDLDESDPDVDARRAYGRYAGMGLTFALTIIAFGWFGWWIDGKLGTAPVFLIAGALAGFAGGLISMIKRIPPARGRNSKAKPDSARHSDLD